MDLKLKFHEGDKYIINDTISVIVLESKNNKVKIEIEDKIFKITSDTTREDIKRMYYFYKLKNRPFKNVLYNSTEYENYYNSIKSQPLTKEKIKEYKNYKNIHYTADTILGNYIYNAKVIKVAKNYIIIKPAKWKEYLKIEEGENLFIGKGYI